jgi:hypothetical protein
VKKTSTAQIFKSEVFTEQKLTIGLDDVIYEVQETLLSYTR